MDNLGTITGDGAKPLGSDVTAGGVQRPLTKRPMPVRKPSGPRQAFRPIHNNAQDENVVNVDTSRGGDVMQSNSNATAISIDPSCLNELDEQLLASPIDSFMDVCWADALGENEQDSPSDSPTIYEATICGPQRVSVDYQDLDPLASDNEKWNGDADVSDVLPVENRRESQKLYAYPDSQQPSLTFWEPHFTIPNPNDTVHGFPSRPPKSRRRRKIDILATARSYFPHRLVRSPT